MNHRASTSFRWLVPALCVLGVAASAGPARAAVSVALTTASQDVSRNADVDVFLDIPGASSGFNAFNLVVSYDPTALTLVPAAPTTGQQGCLMTGACSGACGQTFHQFAAAGDSVSVSDVLLCNLVSLSGPGRLYRLRFHTANRSVITYVRIRRVHFFDAGILVPVAGATDLGLAIGATTGVTPGGAGGHGALRAEPNPAAGHVRFVSVDDREAWTTCDVLDLQGRVVRRLGPVWLAARGALEWDRTDARGVRVPAGVYLVRVQRGAETAESRLVLLH
jgi:hypothetical protein